MDSIEAIDHFFFCRGGRFFCPAGADKSLLTARETGQSERFPLRGLLCKHKAEHVAINGIAYLNYDVYQCHQLTT